MPQHTDKANIKVLMLYHCITIKLIFPYSLGKSVKLHQPLGCCYTHRVGNSGTAGLHVASTVVSKPAAK